MGVTTKAAARVVVAIDLKRRLLERLGDAMFLPACPPSFVRHICRATGLRGELRLEFQPGRFALVKCSVD
jgi:hypothetical protein